MACRIAKARRDPNALKDKFTYLRNIPRNVLSFDCSSGVFSDPGVAIGGAERVVSVDIADGAVEGAGEG